jgi:hypothetical protein
MAESLPTANPFALMMTPEVVFAAIERSERLGRLKSRICRPLDGPRAPQPAAAEEPAAEVEAFDAAVEAAPVELEPEVEADFETGFEAGFSSTDFEAPTWATTQYE